MGPVNPDNVWGTVFLWAYGALVRTPCHPSRGCLCVQTRFEGSDWNQRAWLCIRAAVLRDNIFMFLYSLPAVTLCCVWFYFTTHPVMTSFVCTGYRWKLRPRPQPIRTGEMQFYVNCCRSVLISIWKDRFNECYRASGCAPSHHYSNNYFYPYIRPLMFNIRHSNVCLNTEPAP